MNFIKKIKGFILALYLLLLPLAAWAANAADQLRALGTKAGFDPDMVNDEDAVGIIGQIIYALLAFLGIAFFLLMIYGGWRWMTARGNEQQVEEARKTIINASIGLAVIFVSYAFTWFIMSSLGSATSGDY